MWPQYKIVDNILTSEHFDLIKNINFETKENEWEIYKHQIFLDDTVKIAYKSSSDNTQQSDVFPLSYETILEIYRVYNPIMLNYLKELAKEKISQYKFTELNVVSTGKDYKFSIHNDSKDKLLSVVIYISPEINKGTFLYNDMNGSDMKMIEWIPNRAFIFSRTQNTWHSYKSDGLNKRLTLVYNLRGQNESNQT